MGTKSNIAVARAIGAGERMCAEATEAIVATLPEGFDPSTRGAVAEAVHAWACGAEVRPAVKTGRAGEQKSTDYGRGVDALVKSVKRALTADVEKPVTLRANLSGEGGGSVVIPADHKLYGPLVALIAAANGAAPAVKAA